MEHAYASQNGMVIDVNTIQMNVQMKQYATRLKIKPVLIWSVDIFVDVCWDLRKMKITIVFWVTNFFIFSKHHPVLWFMPLLEEVPTD